MLRTDSATIVGRVQDSKGTAVGNGIVVLLPPSSRYESQALFRYARSVDTDGHFDFGFKAPGEYKVYAVKEIPQNWTYAEFTKHYDGAGQVVRVAPGASLTLRVTAIP
jgi:hypothetical protein